MIVHINDHKVRSYFDFMLYVLSNFGERDFCLRYTGKRQFVTVPDNEIIDGDVSCNGKTLKSDWAKIKGICASSKAHVCIGTTVSIAEDEALSALVRLRGTSKSMLLKTLLLRELEGVNG